MKCETPFLLWSVTRATKRRCARKAPLMDSNGAWCRTDLRQRDVFAAHRTKRFQSLELAILQQDSGETDTSHPAIFLGVQKAFDRTWRTGILVKIKRALPAPCRSGISSAICSTTYIVMICRFRTKAYLKMLATFADDVYVTYRSRSELEAVIQDCATIFSEWDRRWDIGINSGK